MNRNLRNQNTDNQPGTTAGDDRQELDWLAFRYVSDEMPETEREQFEKRLETDSVAQTALVDVMQQTQLIYAALDAEQKTVQLADKKNTAIGQPRFKRRTALLAAAAALLLMFAGWGIISGTHNAPRSGVTSGSAQSATDLAVAWADTLADKDLVLVENELDELAADESEFDDFLTDDTSTNETEDWMYIALIEMQESTEGPE